MTKEPQEHPKNNRVHAVKYRPDIDGLRAIAVLAVVLFHFGVPGLTGGFIGVDVFFVISGYLITTIVAREIENNSFSYLSFYTRRALRILPAAILVVLATVACGYWLLLPSEFANLGTASKKFSYFTSNIYFMQITSDYWNQSTLAVQPLLHTWSLSIEEQFYIALPPLLFMTNVLQRRIQGKSTKVSISLSVIAILWSVSFIYGIHLVNTDQSKAFYSILSRAWELLTGSLLAVVMASNNRTHSVAFKNIVGSIGLFLLLACIFFYDEKMSFPGLNALLPCFCTALLIYSGGGVSDTSATSVTQKILGSKPLVFVGLISYSLYLWHWPILVLTKSVTWKAREFHELGVISLLVISVTLAYLTWKFVETPSRSLGKSEGGKRITIVCSITALACIYIIGATVTKIGDMKIDFRQPVPEILTTIMKDNSVTPGMRCEGSKDPDIILNNGGGCVVGENSTNNPTFALVGDSHARMWAHGIDEKAKTKMVNGLLLAQSSCIPILGLTPPTRNECLGITAAKIKYIQKSDIKKIVLAGYWAGYWREMGGSNRDADSLMLEITKTIKAIRSSGKQVYLMLDIPELASNQESLILALDSLKYTTAGPTLKSYKDQQGYLNQKLREIASTEDVTILSSTDVICGKTNCISAEKGKTFYRDSHHLTDAGSVRFNSIFNPVFN